jgi:hypothetical protein
MFCLNHMGMVGMSLAMMSSAAWYRWIAVASSAAWSAFSRSWSKAGLLYCESFEEAPVLKSGVR